MSINGNRPDEGAANSVGINNATEPNRLAPTTQAIKGSNGLAGVALLDAALRYASAGFAVFPCQPRMKEPAVARGFLAATTNPQTIRRLWRVTNRNIGLRTGAASSVWVLDIDGPAGEASLVALEATHGALPVTCTVITQKGRHLWFVKRCEVVNRAEQESLRTILQKWKGAR